MKTPRLIVIGGRKRAGKGTISQRLIEKHGYVGNKFANTLKDMLTALYRRCHVDDATIERLIEGDLKEVALPAHGPGMPSCLNKIPFFGASSRFAMQKLGSEWRDFIHPELWVTITRYEIERAWESGQRVVVDDLRFPHEYRVVRSMGGVTWRVVNPNLPPNADNHDSEKELPDSCYDHTLINDGSISDIWEKVDALLKES
jgi:hypothetical protein